jgi:bile acid:Na+ symporter, BASS family
MDPKQLVILAFQISIICTVFGFGLKTRLDDLLYLVRQPGLLVRSIVSVFVIMPVVAVAIAQWFDFPRTVEIALIALSISPTPPLLPRREAKSGGHEDYGLGLMALLAALSIVVVPLSAELLSAFVGRPLAAPSSAIAGIVFISVLLPLGVGMAVRALAPAIAERLDKLVAMIVKILLPPALVVLLIVMAPAMWRLIGGGTLVAMLLFLAIGFVVGHVMGGPDPDHAIVLAISTACRHPAIALSIASANFPDEQFGAAILLYLLLGVVAGVPYTVWGRRHMTAHVPA